MDIQEARMATIDMEVTINAKPAAVWKALVEDIGQWWPADFYAGGVDGKRNFAIEARLGGRMYEEWQAGGGVLWGTVVTIDPGRNLQVLGHSFPNWGGPSQWYGSWTLSTSGAGTVLAFSESAVGQVSAAGMDDKDKGWQFLWNSLKAHVEGQPAPTWPH